MGPLLYRRAHRGVPVGDTLGQRYRETCSLLMRKYQAGEKAIS